MFDLTGRGAIITGSSRGIGRAIAEMLAAHGANVIISSRKQEACDAVAEAINAKGQGRATAIPASISSKADIERLVREGREALGQIDILVCNAASNPHYGPMSTLTDELFDKTLKNNIVSNHWLCQAVAPEMIARKDGSIIIIGSMGGYRGTAVIGAYNITKAADFQLARNLAVEFGASGVRVNCIAPGLIKTDFARALWEDPANLEKALSGTPLARIGLPEDVAGAALFLASDASRYVTGQSIVVDGGATITVSGV